ncbi:hypothetical protein DFH09DRAFT_1114138 [Mycena vulgaris]|nr:hypothetical protein DFH09DRAFT_1114138 [Mycena vulgaris]
MSGGAPRHTKLQLTNVASHTIRLGSGRWCLGYLSKCIIKKLLPFHNHPTNCLMLTFPPELWPRIFSFVKDNETFKDIVLTSRQFNAFAQEELIRNMYWRRGEDVEPRLAQWSTHPKRYHLKELNVRLLHSSSQARANVAGMSIFPNLGELTIRNGRITEEIHAALAQLPHLHRLRLQWCFLERVTRAQMAPSTVRHLVLHDSCTEHDRQDYEQMQNLTLIPLPLLNGLDTLFLSSDMTAAHPIQQAYTLLPDAPNVVTLRVTGPPSTSSTHASQPAPTPLVLRGLITFRGPYCIAVEVLPAAAHIADFTLTDAISGAQALHIITRLHADAVRNVELTLIRWDPEVLREIAHRFLQCKRIKIVHYYLGPSHEFLFDLGIQHLARMKALNTLLIRARPQDAMNLPGLRLDDFRLEFGEYRRAYKEWEAEGRAGLRHVPPQPSVEECREYLTVWTPYNPHLEVVALGRHVWTRAFRGIVWSAEMAG